VILPGGVVVSEVDWKKGSESAGLIPRETTRLALIASALGRGRIDGAEELGCQLCSIKMNRFD
jgi:hypothetical protein